MQTNLDLVVSNLVRVLHYDSVVPRFFCPQFPLVLTGSVPVSSGLGTTMVVTAAFAGLYAAAFLRWIRRNRRVRACGGPLRCVGMFLRAFCYE